MFIAWLRIRVSHGPQLLVCLNVYYFPLRANMFNDPQNFLLLSWLSLYVSFVPYTLPLQDDGHVGLLKKLFGVRLNSK